MKEIIAFSKEKDIFEILGWDYPVDADGEKWYNNQDYQVHHQLLWDMDFNLDDWDIGFACREKLHQTWVLPCGKRKEKDWVRIEDMPKADQTMVGDTEWSDPEYTDSYTEWDPDVEWLGLRMENYCVGFHYCYFAGYHWYTVHHSQKGK